MNMPDPLTPPQSSHPRPSRRRWLWLLPLVVFIGFAMLLASRLGKNPEVQIGTALGKPVPVFDLPDLADGTRRSRADLPKQPFVLNVWGSWCPSCKVEHPLLMQMAAQGVVLVGVNYKDEPADALGYLAQHGNPFRMNLADQDGTLGLDLGLTGAPESFVVDGRGQIRQHIVGVIDAQVVAKRIQPCLAQLQTAPDAAGAQACQ